MNDNYPIKYPNTNYVVEEKIRYRSFWELRNRYVDNLKIAQYYAKKYSGKIYKRVRWAFPSQKNSDDNNHIKNTWAPVPYRNVI